MRSLTENGFQDVLDFNKINGAETHSLKSIIFSNEQWQCKLEFLVMSNTGVTKVFRITRAFSVDLRHDVSKRNTYIASCYAVFCPHRCSLYHLHTAVSPV